MDSQPTPEQLILIKGLSDDKLESIYKALLASACEHWRKASRIVSMAMDVLPNKVNGIPDAFYSKRVTILVQESKLLSQGDLNCTRYSEVKLP